VNERWVCKRCFADNNEADAACTRCGLGRGADATDGTDATAAGAWAAPAIPEPPAWQRYLRFWWIPLIVVVLAVGYFTTARRGDDGSLNSAGTVGVDDLRVGDCFEAGDAEEISDVDGVPCDEPHPYEVYVVEDHDASSYPSDAEWDTVFLTRCVPSFEPYVGADYATSEIYASMMTPTADGWSAGDHEIICYLFEPLGDSLTESVELTASLRGAGR
jgi:hypothetical protein